MTEKINPGFEPSYILRLRVYQQLTRFCRHEL